MAESLWLSDKPFSLYLRLRLGLKRFETPKLLSCVPEAHGGAAANPLERCMHSREFIQLNIQQVPRFLHVLFGRADIANRKPEGKLIV